MIMYKMVYLQALHYTMAQTVLRRYESSIANEEMRSCRQIRRKRITNSQIWGILNEVQLLKWLAGGN
jgi:hypothetical protein